jgi:hypothetical protein
VPECAARITGSTARVTASTANTFTSYIADLRVGELLDRGKMAATSVVDEDVDATEVLDGRSDGRVDLRGIGHIQSQREQRVTRIGERGPDLLLVPRGGNDLMAA